MNILNNNGKYHFFNALTIEQELKPITYLFNFDDNGNCWLEDVEAFKFPEKVYDVSDDLREMIKKSYNSNNKNLGVLLCGNKGQGKTFCAKLISANLGIPTILINKQIPSYVNFVAFLNEIKQNYILFVDEFEKLFDAKKIGNTTDGFHTQETFLSFMDGVLTNEHKVLFLLTSNDSVNEFFINRPSRIKFLKEYTELPEDLFNLITDDKLVNKEFKTDLEDNVSLVNLNIDLLISIIDDINLFNKPFSSFKNMYNYTFEQYKYEVYHVENGGDKFQGFFTSGKKLKYTDTYINGHSINDMVQFKSTEIIYNTEEWAEDKNGKDYKKNITVKLVPFTKMGITSNLVL